MASRRATIASGGGSVDAAGPDSRGSVVAFVAV
jgi:hypothetical protein